MTPEDAVKYTHTHPNLLIRVTCYPLPLEVVVLDNVSEGQYVKLKICNTMEFQWHASCEVDVLEILHTPELAKPLKPLTFEPESSLSKHNSKKLGKSLKPLSEEHSEALKKWLREGNSKWFNFPDEPPPKK